MGGFCDGRTVWSLWFDPTPLRHSALAAECGCGAGFATVVRIGAVEAFAALGVGRAASLASAVCVIGSDAPAASAAVSDVAAACPVALDFGALGLVTLGLGALGLPAPTARRGACAGGVVAEEALAAAGERRRRESRALVLHGKDEHRGRAARRAAHRAPHRAARPAARTFFARSLRSRRPAVRILHPRVQPLMFVARTPDRGRRARGRPGLVSRRFRILACEREAHRAACGRMVAGVVHEVECGPFQRHGVAEKRRGLRATDEGLLPHGFEAHASSIGHAPRRLIARVRPRRGVDALPAHARPAAAGRVDDQAHVRVEPSGALGCRLGGLARVEGKPLLLA